MNKIMIATIATLISTAALAVPLPPHRPADLTAPVPAAPTEVDGCADRTAVEKVLADGEFVIPADVVSHLGNGSTNAGAKKLYAMMSRVRKARTGKTKQAPAVKMDRHLPA